MSSTSTILDDDNIALQNKLYADSNGNTNRYVLSYVEFHFSLVLAVSFLEKLIHTVRCDL